MDRARGGRGPVRVRVRDRQQLEPGWWTSSSSSSDRPTTAATRTNSNDNNHNRNRHDPQHRRRTGTNQASNKAISLLKVSALRRLIFAANTCYIRIWCAAGGGAPPNPPRATKSALHLQNPRLPRNQHFSVNSLPQKPANQPPNSHLPAAPAATNQLTTT